MLYRLIILTGQKAGEQLTVLRPSMTVGSGPDSSVRIPDEEMASKHALFEHDATGLLIRDLGTMHKLLVNHHQVEQCRLKHGDEIEIGRTRFLVQATVRAEVDSTNVFADVQRKKRPRNLLAWVYLAAGLTVAYLFARPFLTSSEAPDETDPISNRTVTGALVRVTSPTNSVINNNVSVSSNVVPQNNTATNKPAQSQLTNVITQLQTNFTPAVVATTNKVAAPVLAASNTAITSTQQTHAATVPAHPGTSPSNRITASRTTTLPSAPIIKIVSAEQHKFPGTFAYEEMRTLTVKLQQAPTVEIDADAVTLEVVFFDILFDNNTGKGDIAPSKMLVSGSPMKVAGQWSPDRHKIATATYTVPNRNTPAGVRRPQFYGFTIRVFNNGVLQDQTCRPSDLKDYISR